MTAVLDSSHEHGLRHVPRGVGECQLDRGVPGRAAVNAQLDLKRRPGDPRRAVLRVVLGDRRERGRGDLDGLGPRVPGEHDRVAVLQVDALGNLGRAVRLGDQHVGHVAVGDEHRHEADDGAVDSVLEPRVLEALDDPVDLCLHGDRDRPPHGGRELKHQLAAVGVRIR